MSNNITTQMQELGLHYETRRKRLLELMLKSGHPRAISQTTYANHFGVTQAQICADQKVIKTQLSEIMDKDLKLKVDMFYDAAILHYIKNKEFDKAFPIVKGWTDWLFNTGKIDKTPEKLEHDLTITTSLTEEELKAAAEALMKGGHKVAKDGKVLDK